MAKEEDDDHPWNTTSYIRNHEVQIAEGMKDPNF